MNIHTDLACDAVGVLKSTCKQYKKYGSLKVIETKVDKECIKTYQMGVYTTTSSKVFLGSQHSQYKHLKSQWKYIMYFIF